VSSSYQFEEEEFSSQFNGGTLRRIFQQIRPYWRRIIGFLVAVAATSMIDAYFTYLGKRIIDEGIVPRNPQALVQVIIVFGLMILVQAGCVFTFIYLCASMGQRVMYDLRKKIFDHLQSLSFSYFNQTPVGWIMSRVTSDTERISELVTWGMLDVTWSVMNILTALFFMLTINWQLSLVVFALIPVLLAIAVWFKTRILVEYRQVRKLNSKITGTYNENITGVRVVKALVREQGNLVEFDELAGSMYKSAYRAAWLSALFLPIVQLISAVAVGVVVLASGSQVQAGGMTIGGIQAFIAYITFMLWPVQEMARVYAEMQQAIASAERFFSLLDAKPEVVDRPNAEEVPTVRGDIEFENVEFAYSDAPDKLVLKNFNLKVKQGETIALVGPTGAGKTTVVNLVARFFEPTKGVIRINGRDYTEYTLHAIHSKLGVVLQTPHLFSGNIRENIRYGRLDATDAEIEEAAKLAGAHDFITTLEHGYEEEVGEGGVLLSVGQKQLISLARAILAKPEIFIMDEATSSVDTLTEALIQRGMENLMKQCTSFVIAHRLSTIRRADRILVVENGGISEMGSHAELMRLKGHYYNLYTRQFRDELEAQFDPFADKVTSNGHSSNGHKVATEAMG
jgi:ATP-binding cassette subfamily B protein